MTNTSSPHDNARGLAEQVKGLIADVSTLFRQEIQLAKTEASERLSSAVHGAQMLVIGGILAIGALGVLLAGIVAILATAFQRMGMEPTLANAAAAVIVAVVVGGLGWAIMKSGINRLKTSNFKLEKTAHSLSEDANVVKERI